MEEQIQAGDTKLLSALKERTKELNCLYTIEETIHKPGVTLEEIFQTVIQAIKDGWQYSHICRVLITYKGKEYHGPHFQKSPWFQEVNIIFQGEVAGKIEVYYIKEMPEAFEGPFLKEERKLLNTISERISHMIMQRHLEASLQEMKRIKEDISQKRKAEWRVILDLLSSTDRNLLIKITRRMMNYLCRTGISQACFLIQNVGSFHEDRDETGMNRPSRIHNGDNYIELSNEIFDIASQNLRDDQILDYIQKWIIEEKARFLVDAAENFHTSIPEIANALRRYYHLKPEERELSNATEKSVLVSLIYRFFTEQLEFINIAKNYIDIMDFYNLTEKTIFSPRSHGKVGGKSAGLFLAEKILKKNKEHSDLFRNLKVPKTWYVTSDGLLSFISYNNLEDVIEQKYKEIDQVRQEYPQIVQVFKSSYFPPEMINGLSTALDDFGDNPIIVRSSSLLEDRLGASFSGKYKSLFLANQGNKQEKLSALLDAIAEIYASTFNSDPIEYRAERGLLDFHEEMGILIQQVVGKKIGRYFLPSFAGVAFSNNEFRWSPRIKREDGLIRMVPGLGTRAVDRLSDDYPVLIAPGQPDLRANVTVDEIVRYSPGKVDVINLETNTFETVEIKSLLKEYGYDFPGINKLVSIYEHNYIRRPMGFEIDFERDNLVFNFEGLIKNTNFVKQMDIVLKLLKEKLGTPVDIEFASDGTDFYLLQCRPQSYSLDNIPSPIPKDVPEKDIIFSANRYVSNGKVPDITHIVYVDPGKYNEIESLSSLDEVGRIVGKLNKRLPKRQFILMGPGRWGSRGDIKLGVKVTYSDINNCAVLIEIARKKGDYIPDLSFGTHFFQDLVEAGIRYLPLYPDLPEIIFNERFLTSSYNILPDILPKSAGLQDVIKVIDVSKTTGGQVLRILMNADLDEAVGILALPEKSVETVRGKTELTIHSQAHEDYWLWRLHMAERLAKNIDPEKFGIKGLYIFGSTKNATAGPGSDIDLIVHFQGSPEQKETMMLWFQGWSLCLSELNFLRTGYKTDGLLDIHIVTDEDIKKRTSYAVKIGAVTDAARPLALN